MKVKTMTRMALLSAIALTIFWVEAQIPMPIPVPGVKLGLANVVTVYAVFSLGAWEAGGDSVGSGPAGLPVLRSNDEPAVFCCWGSAGASDRPGPEADFDRNANLGRQLFQCGGSQPGTNCRRDCHHPDPGAPVLSASPFGIRPAHWPLHRTRRPDLAPASP